MRPGSNRSVHIESIPPTPITEPSLTLIHLVSSCTSNLNKYCVLRHISTPLVPDTSPCLAAFLECVPSHLPGHEDPRLERGWYVWSTLQSPSMLVGTPNPKATRPKEYTPISSYDNTTT